jgi:glyoxylase-like metal-dependent hydrolase (beta-lactamase superfamily II)
MKILREFSTIKREYPVNPYAEVYPFRDNLHCIFTESLDGAGDPWMYLIDGPEKCMLIDTGFGVGDLKGLIKDIVGEKPVIVANTHSHYDHAYGNCQFETCHCHEYEVPRMKQKNNPHIWDYLFGADGKPIWTEFDRNDIVGYHEYVIVGVKDGTLFDLGGGYKVEAVHLPGHTPGQCAYYDHHNRTIFTGDTTNIGSAAPGEPFGEFCTVRALRDALLRLKPRFAEIQGVFPGHGMLDQSGVTLQFLLDAAEAVIAHPDRYDSIAEFVRKGQTITSMTKNVYQGSAIRYGPDNIG